MANIKIKPKKSYSIQEFHFGCSMIDSEQSVSNWQDGNNTFDVPDGTWFCFAKKKNSNRVSKMVKIVNCGQVCTITYIAFRKRLSCTITGIIPYIKNTTPVQLSCTITGIIPYIKNTTPVQLSKQFTGVTSINV